MTCDMWYCYVICDMVYVTGDMCHVIHDMSRDVRMMARNLPMEGAVNISCIVEHSFPKPRYTQGICNLKDKKF